MENEASRKNTCPQQDRIKEMERNITGHAKTLYGPTGREGINADTACNKAQIKDMKEDLYNGNGKLVFMKKISPAIWVPLLIVIGGAGLGAGYNASNAVSKEDFKQTQTEVCNIKEDVKDIKAEMKETRQKVDRAVEQINKDMKDAMREQKKDLKELIESLHDHHE